MVLLFVCMYNKIKTHPQFKMQNGLLLSSGAWFTSALSSAQLKSISRYILYNTQILGLHLQKNFFLLMYIGELGPMGLNQILFLIFCKAALW